MNEMNPGSFSFGPLWWAVFLAVMALAVVAVMCLFLWQASKESAPPAAAHERRDRAVGSGPARQELPVAREEDDDDRAILVPAQRPIGRPA